MRMGVNKDLILNHYVPMGLPVPYQNFTLYPVKVKQSYFWDRSAHILLVDKEYANNVEIIQMSYLRYLIEWGVHEQKVLDSLSSILSIVLQLEDRLLELDVNEKQEFSIVIPKVKQGSDGLKPVYQNAIRISEKEFEDLRKIILFQNVRDWDDEYVDPDVKKSIDEYYRILNKQGAHVEMERKIAAVVSQTGLTLNEIQEMPYRMFQNIYDSMVERIDYEILKVAEIHGAEFKKPIEHWVNRNARNKYDEAFVSYDKVESKITGKGN